MQARAIFEAAISMTNQGIQVFPEIMVPLVGTPQVCLSSRVSSLAGINVYLHFTVGAVEK